MAWECGGDKGAEMTANNGWPGKPGVPMHPERDGWHWMKTGHGVAPWLWRDDPQSITWEMGWETNEEVFAPGDIARVPGTTYLGPCLTPDEAAKREDVKWHEGYAVGVLDVRRGTAFGEPDTHYAALQKRVAELEDLIRAVHRNAKNLAGDRTFDQCITALMRIDDLCRSALGGKDE